MNFSRRWRAAAAALFSPDLDRVLEQELSGLQLKLVEAKMQQVSAIAKVHELQSQIHYLVLTRAALIAEPEDVVVSLPKEEFDAFLAARAP